MDSRKTKIIIIAVLCSIVGILSIGYAVLSARLKISGTATVPGGKCDAAFVDEEKSVETNGSAKCEFGEITKTSITGLKATFTKPGDSCTFTIPAKNDGSLVNYLADVVGKNTSLTFEGTGDSAHDDEDLLKQFVKYEVTYDSVKITDSTDFSKLLPLQAGEKKNVTLKIEFSYEATAVPKSAVNISGLDRTFVYNCGRINSEGDFSPQCEDGKLLTPTPVSTPNAPVLNGEMIPVYYDEDKAVWKKADGDNTNNEWYDYNKQKWANAVTVTSTSRAGYKSAASGTTINDTDINTMWVWIPRYSYTIKSEDGGKNYYGKRSSCEEEPSQTLPGEIDVKFVDKDTTDVGTAQYTGDTATNWRTNEAFNFGGTSHDGLWVAKFETTGSLKQDEQTCVDINCDVSEVTIKPGVPSLRNQIVSSFFFMARSMQLHNYDAYGFESTIGDLHMIKNDEWGAVVYLSQSEYGKYGNSSYTGVSKEVYINNNSSYITGNSGGTPNAKESDEKYSYNDMSDLDGGKGQAGPGASTTGNITGIYDMNGGSYEYVMGILEYDEQGVSVHNGGLVTLASGFRGLNQDASQVGTIELPQSKYYNIYKSADPTSLDISNSETACNGKICYGHSLSETKTWYNDYANFIGRTHPWIERGGYYRDTSIAGIFHTANFNGSANNLTSSRFTLIV